MPGWELPKIQPENYAEGYGFISDYLAEIFTKLRRRNFQTIVSARVAFHKVTGRNQDAMKKIAAGLLKLVYPHRNPDDIRLEELERCLDLALECRRRITDQLAIMAKEEFGEVRYNYSMR